MVEYLNSDEIDLGTITTPCMLEELTIFKR